MKAVWLLPGIRWPGCSCTRHCSQEPWDLGPVCCAKAVSAQGAGSSGALGASLLAGARPGPALGAVEPGEKFTQHTAESANTGEQAWPWPLQDPGGGLGTPRSLYGLGLAVHKGGRGLSPLRPAPP